MERNGPCRGRASPTALTLGAKRRPERRLILFGRGEARARSNRISQSAGRSGAYFAERIREPAEAGPVERPGGDLFAACARNERQGSANKSPEGAKRAVPEAASATAARREQAKAGAAADTNLAGACGGRISISRVQDKTERLIPLPEESKRSPERRKAGNNSAAACGSRIISCRTERRAERCDRRA